MFVGGVYTVTNVRVLGNTSTLFRLVYFAVKRCVLLDFHTMSFHYGNDFLFLRLIEHFHVAGVGLGMWNPDGCHFDMRLL